MLPARKQAVRRRGSPASEVETSQGHRLSEEQHIELLVERACPVMFWWRNTVSAQDWDGRAQMWAVRVREGFLEEEGPSGQMRSDSVELSARPWCLDGSV